MRQIKTDSFILAVVLSVLFIIPAFAEPPCVPDARNDIKCFDGKRTPNLTMPYTPQFPDPAGVKQPPAKPATVQPPTPQTMPAPKLQVSPKGK